MSSFYPLFGEVGKEESALARKLGLLCVFCSIAYCMFTQQKSDYTNINNFVNIPINKHRMQGIFQVWHQEYGMKIVQ